MRHPISKLRTSGFSLIEVLVALLVLSIGLLGLAALQVTGIRFNHQSYQRTQATVLIYEIVDRMRANPQALGSYVIAIGAGTPTAATNCDTASCSITDLATYDLNRWRTAINTAIGSQASSIQQNGALFTITIQWTEHDMTLSQTLDVRVI